MIPPGTAARLKAGEPLNVLPSPIHLTVGVRDVLVITNDDEAIHQVGPIILGSRQTYRIPFRRPGHVQVQLLAPRGGHAHARHRPAARGRPRPAALAPGLPRHLVVGPGTETPPCRTSPLPFAFPIPACARSSPRPRASSPGSTCEAALARAQAELGIIPEAAAREIVKKAQLVVPGPRRGAGRARKTGHPLVPLVWELDKACEGDAGGYVHWGATTQNITQTGQLLQARRAHEIFLGQLAAILTTLADLAERSKDMLLPGRTHGQHAVPATFGFKVAVWIDELGRHVERLIGCEERVFVAMLGGGAGTLASLGEPGLATQAQDGGARSAWRRCPCPRAPSATIRRSTCALLGMLAATCSKVGREIYTLMKQEFGEVEEPVPAGTVGSSTMPQKRNPKLSQDIIAAAAADPRARPPGARSHADRARGRPDDQHHDEPRARGRPASSPATCSRAWSRCSTGSRCSPPACARTSTSRAGSSWRRR